MPALRAERMTVQQLLDAFQKSVTADERKNWKAELVWEYLWQQLTENQYMRLQEAWCKYEGGLGRSELDAVCVEIRASWEE